jgi:hypothetical protein
MFPITNAYKQKIYNTKNLFFQTVLEPYIKNNLKDIIAKAQSYLSRYESGERPLYAVDIEAIMRTLNLIP